MIALIAGLLLCFTQAAPPADFELYYLAFLRPEPARKPISKEETGRIQAAHMANIQSMAKRGVLVAAGPFDDPDHAILGVFVLKTASLDEARRIAAEDPTVVEHRNQVDVHAWRGSAGIGAEYFRLHKEKPDTPEGMGVQPLGLLYRGAAWDQHPEIWSAHGDYLSRLRREGKLAAAGRIEGDEDLVGVEVFARIPDEEARRLLENDPAVKAGSLRLEYHRWWCAEHVLPGGK